MFIRKDEKIIGISKMQKSILFLGGKYYGNSDASGICCKNLYDECCRQGISGYVLGYSEKSNLCGLYKKNNEYEFSYTRERKKQKSILNSVKRCIYPNIDNQLIDIFFEYASKIIDEKKINIVVGIFFPFEMIEILYRLKNRYKNILVIDYEVDSATDIYKHTSKLGCLHALATKRYLKNMYYKMDYICVLQSHYQHFLKNYKLTTNKTIRIDAPFLIEQIKPIEKGKKTIDFLYTGFLDKDNYSPEPFFRFFEMNKDKKDWRLHIISRGNCEDLIKKESEKDNRIIQHGYVEYELTKKYLASADFLLSIEYKNKPSSIPAKVFNYFSTGKPIIHFCSGDYLFFCKNYIDVYGLGLNVNIKKGYDNATLLDFVNNSMNKHVNYGSVIRNFELSTPSYSIRKIKELSKGIKEEN